MQDMTIEYKVHPCRRVSEKFASWNAEDERIGTRGTDLEIGDCRTQSAPISSILMQPPPSSQYSDRLGPTTLELLSSTVQALDMASLFGLCFGGKDGGRRSTTFQADDQQTSLAAQPAGSRKVDNINPAKCVFCNVDPSRFNIILEDASYICFRDRSPAASAHLLVIPRRHIANVQTLTAKDVELVREMQALGNKALDLLKQNTAGGSAGERRFGFHIPPFRSVDHLHLHCLQLPFKSSLSGLKYRVAHPPNKNYSKGWSWFAEWKQTCSILDKGGKVKVSRC